MKNLAILAISILFLSSCSGDEETAQNNILGEWQLIRTTGQFDDVERTGEEMEWQEAYILKADNTFIKKRERDNEIKTAEGTFIIHHGVYTHGQSGVSHISMVYESENEIIATCYSDKLQEELYFVSDELMESTWKECDGLGLEYSKVENN